MRACAAAPSQLSPPFSIARVTACVENGRDGKTSERADKFWSGSATAWRSRGSAPLPLCLSTRAFPVAGYPAIKQFSCNRK
jgi:hypothetical protein